MKMHAGRWDGDRLLDDKTGKPVPRLSHPGPRQLANISAPFTIDFTHLYLGVDDSQVSTVRTVCLDASAIRTPWPIACLTFKRPAEFLAYIKSCVRESGALYVASSPEPNRVSGPSIHYLEEIEGIPVARLGQAQTLSYEEEWDLLYGVEPGDFDAFGLALSLAYSTEAPTLLNELLLTAHEAESRLQTMTRTLRRLTRATQVPF